MGCGTSAPAAPVIQSPPKKRHHHHHHHKKHKAKNAEAKKEDVVLAEVAREPAAVAPGVKEIGNFWWPTVQPGGVFDVWVKEQLQNSPDDAKDTENFKYITFTQLPPFTSKHTSLMRNILTCDIFEELQNQQTSRGYTLSSAIQSGVLYPRLGVGFTCGDEESYQVFRDIIKPLVREIHGFEMDEKEHVSDLDADKVSVTEEQLSALSPFVKSIRARGVRNISGYALPPGTLSEDRMAVEALLQDVFASFPSDLEGTYTPLSEVDADQAKELQSSGLLFGTDDKDGTHPAELLALEGCGARRAWPEGRGLFLNESRTIACWCNQEDHCKIIAMEEGCDFSAVFRRYGALDVALQDGLSQRGSSLMKSHELGLLASSPENVGTGLKFSVEIELPAMTLKAPALEKACVHLGLVLDGSGGKGSASKGCRWQISNRQRVGVTEVEIVQKVVQGVLSVVQMEQDAQAAAEKEEGAASEE